MRSRRRTPRPGFEVHGTEGSLYGRDVMTQRPMGTVTVRRGGTRRGRSAWTTRTSTNDPCAASMRPFAEKGSRRLRGQTVSDRWRWPLRYVNRRRLAERFQSSAIDVALDSGMSSIEANFAGGGGCRHSEWGDRLRQLLVRTRVPGCHAESHRRSLSGYRGAARVDHDSSDRRRRHVRDRWASITSPSRTDQRIIAGSYPSGPSICLHRKSGS